jgi:hypothetical protein
MGKPVLVTENEAKIDRRDESLAVNNHAAEATAYI